MFMGDLMIFWGFSGIVRGLSSFYLITTSGRKVTGIMVRTDWSNYLTQVLSQASGLVQFIQIHFPSDSKGASKAPV
jgi:hypothetical protein